MSGLFLRPAPCDEAITPENSRFKKGKSKKRGAERVPRFLNMCRLSDVYLKRGAALRAGRAVLSLYSFEPKNGPAVRAFAVNVRLSDLYALLLKSEPAFYAFLQLQIFLVFERPFHMILREDTEEKYYDKQDIYYPDSPKENLISDRVCNVKQYQKQQNGDYIQFPQVVKSVPAGKEPGKEISDFSHVFLHV